MPVFKNSRLGARPGQKYLLCLKTYKGKARSMMTPSQNLIRQAPLAVSTRRLFPIRLASHPALRLTKHLVTRSPEKSPNFKNVNLRTKWLKLIVRTPSTKLKSCKIYQAATTFWVQIKLWQLKWRTILSSGKLSQTLRKNTAKLKL